VLKEDITLSSTLLNSRKIPIRIILLYFFLLTGGLWHILGYFRSLMNSLASPLLIGLGIWIVTESIIELEKSDIRQNKGMVLKKFLLWSLAVIIGSIIIEGIGVGTGVIFGHYSYGQNLPPYIAGVPLAIGFAWIGMILSSAAMAQKLFSKIFRSSNLATILLTALFMTIFDLFMEPAVIKLGYWHWQSGIIPLQNYFAWFIISSFFVWVGLKTKIFQIKLPTVASHAYLAQLIYFVMIYFKT
jgi:putative membrane protein